MRYCFPLILSLVFSSAVWAQDTEDTKAPVETGWNICNETSYVLRLATATIIETKMSPKGWLRLRPGECQKVETPPGTPRYVYAESASIHQGGVREWKGDVPLCASDKDFEADATISCPLQDLGSRNYMQVDPKETTTTFVEPDNYGEKAEIAGIQRLLRDNGFKMSRIDGYSGRRTSRPLNRFLKSVDLSSSVSAAEKIDALVDGAEKKQSDIGFTVCNNSGEKVWSAIAFRQDGDWESRGWWPVQQEECIRPFTKNLKGMEAHFFALQEDNSAAPDEAQKPDKRLTSVAVTPSQFCIAEARFAASGREFCSDRGYIAANFRPLPNDKEGAKITLTDGEFAELDSLGLRR